MKTIPKLTLLFIGFLGCQKADSTMQAVSKTTPVVSSADEIQQSARKVDTADNEETKPSDEEVTSRIREKITNEKLSSNLQGIKVETKLGKVSIHGIVKTAEDKQKIEDAARTIAGAQNLWSELEVE